MRAKNESQPVVQGEPVSRRVLPPDVLPPGFCIERGANDVLFTEDGKEYIDLLTGSGTVFLGHANPAITSRVHEQLDALWNTGVLPTRLSADARSAIEQFFPSSYGVAVVYSTGMEAVEFAIRVARQSTRRRGILGFAGAMHGKSMAAARLGWSNDLVNLPDFHTVPYLPQRTEGEILDQVGSTLSSRTIAAVVLEPLLGSRGGYIPSRAFTEQLASQCAEAGALLVLDEIFTGFYRTGSPFLHRELGVTPDIVLVGKAMGNGFPVSGVVVNRRYPVEGSMLPGSTFAGNPVGAAAIVATLAEMCRQDMPGKVGAIERTIRATLSDIDRLGIALRGKGALWVLEFPQGISVPAVLSRIVQGGVIVSQTASYVRLLPPATVSPDRLQRACEVVREACLACA